MSANDFTQSAEDYSRIEKALIFLEENFQRQPALKEIAESAYLSEYHFQRIFTRWVGISPKRFLQFLTKERAKKLLEESKNLLDVTYESGLSSPGRLHDLFINCEAVTPGEYKNRGEGVTVSYAFHPTPFGECLIGVTAKGICYLAFVMNDRRKDLIQDLTSKWVKSKLVENVKLTHPFVMRVFSPAKHDKPLNLYLRGTNFQIKVWEALLRVPEGKVVTYEDIAARIGAPKASRAVGNAVGQNPIPFIIPCHRVIKKMGDFGNYHWGSARKKLILGWEAARTEID
jgi:AraC family transcriptional regulator of adaptative response/methylated-DNA-[protein]-cysteine methyltransferase